MSLIRICDRCGTRLDAGPIGVFAMPGDDLELEFCGICAQDVRAFISGRVSEPASEPEPEPEPEQEPDPHEFDQRNKRLVLDDGKIFALRQAGWTWRAIKDELGFMGSEQTIANHYIHYCATHLK